MISQVYPLMRRASHPGTEVPNEVQGFSPGGPGYRKWTLSGEEPYLWAQRFRMRWGGFSPPPNVELDALDALEAQHC